MKKSSILISKLVSKVLQEYIFEGENPFAGAAKETEAPTTDTKADAAPESDKKEKSEPKSDSTGLSFNFNKSAVKKYNTAGFVNNTATAKKITKKGIVATVQPDGVDILVGFDDITEAAHNFFNKST